MTDKPNEAPTRAALAVLSEESAKYTRFVNFDHKQADAEPHANKLLDEHKPDFVGAIELPGRNALSKEGYRSNMRGISIDDVNGAVDEVLIQAYNRDIPTFGVGDGGNEAGMGGRPGIPLALNGKHMAAAPTAKHQITSWNSNLGAEALGAAVLQLHGKLDKLHTPEQQRAMIEASMDAGAVDGVTRGATVDEKIGTVTSGVDGFSPSTHGNAVPTALHHARVSAAGRHARTQDAQVGCPVPHLGLRLQQRWTYRHQESRRVSAIPLAA